MVGAGRGLGLTRALIVLMLIAAYVIALAVRGIAPRNTWNGRGNA